MGEDCEKTDPPPPPVETGRSRRQSPIEAELNSIAGRGSSLDGDPLHHASSLDIFDEAEVPMFQPKLGMFGAPECRWTTSVIALLAITTGMTLITSGACILIFFVDQEPTIMPLGVTLGALGLIMFLVGALMWMSEFMCNDCLGRAYEKMKDAPLKNAIQRRSRMASRQTLRTNSRLSNLSKVSYRSTGSKAAAVSTKY